MEHCGPPVAFYLPGPYAAYADGVMLFNLVSRTSSANQFEHNLDRGAQRTRGSAPRWAHAPPRQMTDGQGLPHDIRSAHQSRSALASRAPSCLWAAAA